MSLDETFSESAPTVGPQIRTLRLVEHVRPEQEQAYLEWSREFSDAHANFINERDPESWSSVVMIRDRAFGRNDVRYVKVFRFPDDAIFEAWTASEERREMIRKGQALNFEVDETALEREFRKRSAEEEFPIFDMFTEDPSKGCSRDRVASACLIGLQVYSLVTLYTYLLGFIPGFSSLHMQLQLLVSTPLVVASIDVVTNQFVVKAARAIGVLPKPPTRWGGAPVVVPPPSPHATSTRPSESV